MLAWFPFFENSIMEIFGYYRIELSLDFLYVTIPVKKRYTLISICCKLISQTDYEFLIHFIQLFYYYFSFIMNFWSLPGCPAIAVFSGRG